MLKVKKYGYSSIIMDYADCPEDGGKYALTCDMHDYLIQDTNKARLWKFADVPADWCMGCAGLDPRFDKYDDTREIA